MTSDTRTLALWGGAGGAVALIGLVWVLIRGATLAGERVEVQRLTSEFALAQPAGVRLDSQIAAVQQAAQEQAKELEQAGRVLAPELKSEYRVSDLTSAANRVATDLKVLRQRAERSRVSLPASLPLESGLDPDETVRQVQLAQLSLYRSALDLVMDAGVTRVTTVALGRAWSDPSGAYAILTTDIDLDAPFEAVHALLGAIHAAQAQGLGVRGVTLTPNTAKPDSPVRVKLTVSLITTNRPEWKLASDKAAQAQPAPRATPGKTPTAASRPGLGEL